MAIKKAQRFGGDFLDLKELAQNQPVLVLFRIKEFKEVEAASGFDGYAFPVIADALICSGPRKGEVHQGERFIGAITSILRGVQNARKDKGQKPQPPVNEVGEEIVARIEVLNPGRNNAAAVGNVPSDADMAAVEEFYGDGVAIWGSVPEQRTEAQPAAAGGRPW